ncbi:carboxypeptidase regulatory-like domain-containing protein [Frondihabitans sp. 762G35]|uniref:carboxypeptidase regulatory-like domain-containing protein n=1 Tax=Frondihabitans sp. 762G35 TaxID=1446794 RepID=UPI000E70675E|nr:carboxypeptidase regulatory-like domain-containing protein [Frondihabitans sp. 762G35]
MAVAAGIALALAGAAALSGASAASAAGAGAWGAVTLSGSSRAYAGTVTLPGGFPSTTFTSTASSATKPSGATVWQAAATPPGAVYGTSSGRSYLNFGAQGLTAGGISTTTYRFATPTPASGWSFVLGDIDADQATVTATDVNGQPVAPAALGFQGAYNYCHLPQGPSCDAANVSDVPSWDAGTGILRGNATAADTEGAAGWFSPTTALESLTITFQQRSGSPVYQTWFATKTFAASGAVTVNEAPYGDAALTIRDASGTVVAETVSAADGSWSVPGLVSTSGYRVSVDTPAGANALPTLTFDTLDADSPGLDFAFTAATIAVTATVTTADGEPVVAEPVVITRDGDDRPTATTTTDAQGTFAADLLPQQTYTAEIGADGLTVTFTTGTTSGPLDVPLVLPAVTPAPAPAPAPSPSQAPAPAPAPVVTPAAAPELASTGSEPVGTIGTGLLLLVGGAALLVGTGRRVRRPRG